MVYDGTFHAFPISRTQPVVNGVALTEQAGYDYRVGLLNSVTDPNLNTTTALYDVFGRMSALFKPGDDPNYPSQNMLYYDTELPFHVVLGQHDDATFLGDYHEIQHFYDGLGQEIQVKTESAEVARNLVVDKQYDGLGQLLAASQPHYVDETALTTFWLYLTTPRANWVNPTSTTYDALGRPLVITNPDSTTVQHRYGIENSLRSQAVIDANQHQTHSRSDALGRLVQVVEDSGNSTATWTTSATTSYSYSPLDLLTATTDQGGNKVTLVYDSAGRKTSMHDPDMGTWSYSYDTNGTLHQQTDAKNQTLQFSYDALDRLTTKTYANGQLASFGYDEAGVPNGKGQRTSMTNSGATIQWQYDARGHQARATWTIPGMTKIRGLAYSYDLADRVATIQYLTNSAVDETVSYSYDVAGRQVSACSSLGGCYVSGAVYTALDQPSQVGLGNALTQAWTYSGPMQRLGSEQLNVTPVKQHSLTYDAGGNLKTDTDPGANETQTFTYDERDRLTNWATQVGAQSTINNSYSYDVLGNLTTKGNDTNTYPASGPSSVRPHAVLMHNNQTVSYDANGNILQDTFHTYTYNADNQPATISYGSNTESYSYDADGTRVTRTTSNGTTAYIGDLLEADVGQNVVRRMYTFNGRVWAQRTLTASSNTVLYLQTNYLGSVVGITDASGTLVDTMRYSPWGEQRNLTMSETTLNYTGQHRDNTALIDDHARYYNPAWGRFMSPDSVVPGRASGSGGAAETVGSGATTPLMVDVHESDFVDQLNQHNAATGSTGFWFQLSSDERTKAESPMGPTNPQALNRYSYVLNNPVRYTDPTGHCAEPISCGLEAGAGGFFVCGLVCAAAGFVAGALVTGAAIGYAYHLATIAKPLTDDEQTQIDRVDQIPGFLDKHPDIAAEAAAQAAGATLEVGQKDHVDEAWDRVESLKKLSGT